MKDKKREEMPDILSDILGNKQEPKNDNKSDIRTLEHHDIMTPQHQDTTVNESRNVKQDEDKIPNDITTSQHHDVIMPVSQDKQTPKQKVYRTTLYLPEDLYNILDEVWLKERKKGLSKNAIIERALSSYLHNA